MAMLLEEETIDGARLYQLLGMQAPTATEVAPHIGVAAANRLRPV
jgi:hypothetical protein